MYVIYVIFDISGWDFHGNPDILDATKSLMRSCRKKCNVRARYFMSHRIKIHFQGKTFLYHEEHSCHLKKISVIGRNFWS